MDCLSRCYRVATVIACIATAAAVPAVAHAVPSTLFVPFSGAGNVSVFDAAAGTGGWVGSIDPSPFPTPDLPVSLVSVVLFQLDAATQSLQGSFEFTTTDLTSVLFGAVSGTYVPPDILVNGGQFSIDYTVQGGSGLFSGASGFGLSFVDYDPAGTFDNYAESGLLLINVPEPTSLALLGAAGVALLAARRRQVRTPVALACAAAAAAPPPTRR